MYSFYTSSAPTGHLPQRGRLNFMLQITNSKLTSNPHRHFVPPPHWGGKGHALIRQPKKATTDGALLLVPLGASQKGRLNYELNSTSSTSSGPPSPWGKAHFIFRIIPFYCFLFIPIPNHYRN